LPFNFFATSEVSRADLLWLLRYCLIQANHYLKSSMQIGQFDTTEQGTVAAEVFTVSNSQIT